MNFTGEKCIVCGEIFTNEDDIVVCPDCGSPHHRDCYKKNNECGNAALHGNGVKWQKQSVVNTPEYDANALVFCPACHYPNRNADGYCTHCGTKLNDVEKIFITTDSDELHENETVRNFNDSMRSDYGTSAYLGFNPDEDMGGATLREVSQFVGTNTLYYIPIFKRMKDIGSKISFNISCFIFPYFYFANRKMWLWAVLATIISVILNIPTIILVMAEQKIFSGNILNMIYDNQNLIEDIEQICAWGSWGVRLLFCMFGNWLYFKFALKSLKKLKARNGGSLDGQLVTSIGGVKPMNMVIIFLIMTFCCAAAMMGITMLSEIFVLLL